MQFVNPLFLIALTSLAIPIIVHLFNFRKYKKVYFTNVRFIAEIKQESKKRSQLRHLLILLMRLLAMACLVFAFAQPYLPSSVQQKKLSARQAVSIYIDNTYSMDALATNGKLLDIAKNKALEIAAAYRPADLFQLLTADFEGKHQRFVNRDEFRILVEEVTSSPSVQYLSSVIKRQDDLLSTISGSNRSAYILSDFQHTSTDLFRIRNDSLVSCYFVPVSAERTNNLYIDSVWFDSPSQQANQAVRLKVRIRNSSTENLEKIPVKLSINKVQKAVASFSIDPEGETVITLPYTNNEQGIQYGTLEIVDYPVTWDDKFYFVYSIIPSLPILCINGEQPDPFLNALFENDSAIQLKNVLARQLDYSSFVRFPLIILNTIEKLPSGLTEELKKYLVKGGNLLILPSPQLDTVTYNNFLSSLGLPVYTTIDTTRMKVSDLNSLSDIYTDVFEKDASGRVIFPENMDMPSVSRHFIITGSTRSGLERLLTLQNGQLFLGVSIMERGRIYLSAVPLKENWTNFMKHPLFVPTIYRIALLSQGYPLLYNQAGTNIPMVFLTDTSAVSEVYKVRKLDSDFEFIPEIRSSGAQLLLYPHDQVKEAGHYNILLGNQVIHGAAFNYNRRESDLNCYAPVDLEKELKQSGLKDFRVFQKIKTPLTKQILEMNQGTPLWKIFIILTLVFLAMEITLIRLMKE
jgi:hypothetical protein